VTLAELAERLACRLEGDGQIEVTRVAGIEDARPGDLTFLANSKYAAKVPTTRASAVIADDQLQQAPCAILRTARPYLAFADAVELLAPPSPRVIGISPLAAVDPTAELGTGVGVGPFVCIGAGVRIGAGTMIHPHVVIGDGTIIGPDCVLHAHVSIRESVVLGARVIVQNAAVIGSDGFGFARRDDGTHQKIPQAGGVVIEDDVEIGAHSAVDRPAIGETRISSGTKIDNLVQVAHGVKIGRNVLLAAQVGIAGSTVLDDDVVMAGQSGATGHIHLGRRVVVGAKSAVTKDVEAGHHVAGIPAGDLAEWREAVVLVRRLPDMRKAIADLEARLAALDVRPPRTR
jgi:UDP-3-O-[3-hydroxymyristoyl] glucosamine N-acyltransferase